MPLHFGTAGTNSENQLPQLRKLGLRALKSWGRWWPIGCIVPVSGGLLLLPPASLGYGKESVLWSLSPNAWLSTLVARQWGKLHVLSLCQLLYFSEMHFIREPAAYTLTIGNGNRTSVVEGGWPPSIPASQPAACCRAFLSWGVSPGPSPY